MVSQKFTVRSLPVQDPPLPRTGGRIIGLGGELAQIISGEPIRLVSYIEFLEGKPRANHFHRLKTEMIYVIKGSLEVTLKDLDDNTVQTVELHTGDLITIQPNCAHRYVPTEYTQTLEMNAVAYDPSDTVPYDFTT